MGSAASGHNNLHSALMGVRPSIVASGFGSHGEVGVKSGVAVPARATATVVGSRPIKPAPIQSPVEWFPKYDSTVRWSDIGKNHKKNKCKCSKFAISEAVQQLYPYTPKKKHSRC